MESQSVVFVTGSAKSLDGIAIFPALSSNRNPQMGTLWAQQGRAFEPVSLYRAARAPEPCQGLIGVGCNLRVTPSSIFAIGGAE